MYRNTFFDEVVSCLRFFALLTPGIGRRRKKFVTPHKRKGIVDHRTKTIV